MLATRYNEEIFFQNMFPFSNLPIGGRRSPAVACWASDHWVAMFEPTQGQVSSLISPHYPGVCLAQFSLNNVHKNRPKTP